MLGPGPAEPDDADEKAPHRTAKMLIELHGRHINEMTRMTTEREALANKLESERAKELGHAHASEWLAKRHR